MSDWLGLKGSNVVVAGAGGIGAACVSAFVDAGAKVAVIDRQKEVLDDLVALHQARGQDVVSITADLTDPGAAEAVIAQLSDAWGTVDVLVHCLGVNDRRPILEIEEATWSRLIDINLSTAFRLGSAVGRMMCDAGTGRVIFLSSVAGLLGHKDHGPYAASKGGMNQLMRVMAAEWAALGVTVNAVAPGYIETPLTANHLSRPGVREQLTGLVPAGRLGTAQEVASSVLFLASVNASFITGHVLYVDGGRTLV